MNFENMPELKWHLGYLFALGLMVLASLTVWILSKRAGWL
jgi:magnesium transporter